MSLFIISRIYLYALAILCLYSTQLWATPIPLTIATGQGSVAFSVDVALTDEEQAKGLMNRHYLPDNKGMLFLFHENSPHYMWMKDTYISLDMLFIDDKCQISYIIKSAEPLSEQILRANGASKAVLEIKGGLSIMNKISPGNKISFATPSFTCRE